MEKEETLLEKRALYFLEEGKPKVINYELNHLKNIVEKLKSYGLTSDSLMASALLSKSIDNRQASYIMLKGTFNVSVANTVYALSKELGKSPKESFIKTLHKVKYNKQAIAIKICDIICRLKTTNVTSYFYVMYLSNADYLLSELINEDSPDMLKRMAEELKKVIKTKI